jgi:hypothetical protein
MVLDGPGAAVPRAFCLRTDCVVPYALGTVIRGTALPSARNGSVPAGSGSGGGGGGGDGGGGGGGGGVAPPLAAGPVGPWDGVRAPPPPAGSEAAWSGAPYDLAARVAVLEADMMRAKCLIMCLHEQVQAQGQVASGNGGAGPGPGPGGPTGDGGPKSPPRPSDADDDFVTGSASKRRR